MPASASRSCARRAANPADPSRDIESPIDVARWTPSPSSVGQHQDDPVVLRQAEGRQDGAVTGTELRAAREEERHVCSDRRRELCEPVLSQTAAGSSSFASRSAAAASELPPPSPAATGIDLVISTFQCGSTPAAAASAASAAGDDRVAVEAGDVEALADRKRDAVTELDALQDRCDLVLAVVPEGADDEREVDLRRCRDAPHASCPRQLDEHRWLERLGPHRRIEPELGQSASTASSRVVTPASWSELASVLRRCAKAPSTTRRTSANSVRQRDSPERDESGVDIGRRPEDGARDGMEPGPRSGELDQHGDGTVRLRRRDGEEAIGNLALHHDAPQIDRRAGRRGSPRRSASRCCRAGSRRAWSGRARGARGRAGERLPSAARRSAAAARPRRWGSRRRSSSTA